MMKSRISILFFIFLTIALIIDARCPSNTHSVWHDYKQIIKDYYSDKVLLGIFGTVGGMLIVKHFYNQHRIQQELHHIKQATQIIHENMSMYDLTQLQIKQEEVDKLYPILMRHNTEDIITGLEQFLGNKWSIVIDNILDKIHICWKISSDYGKPELYKLKALLWACKRQYDCISEPLETIDKDLKLECILLPVRKNK